MNAFMRRLGMTKPIVLAPMAGGPSTPQLAAALSASGCLGGLGSAYLSPEQIVQDAHRVRELTDKPFAINLFSPGPWTDPLKATEAGTAPTAACQPTQSEIETAIGELQPFHQQLGVPSPALPSKAHPDFDAQLAAIVEASPAVFSFAFGRLGDHHMALLRERVPGMLIVGTATSAWEAGALVEDGCDAIIIQGRQAGGHRGGWAYDAMRDTCELVKSVDNIVRMAAADGEGDDEDEGVPALIAAGGIMGPADVRAALEAGASAAQCGTAFLLATEAGTSQPYREALKQVQAGLKRWMVTDRPTQYPSGGGGADGANSDRLAGTDVTTITRAFSGRPARGLRNIVTETVKHPLPFPYQNALTRDMRAASVKAGRCDLINMWAGEGLVHMKEGPASDVVRHLWST